MYEEIIQLILKFREERDWKQFHDPKNLAEGIVIEAAELLEHYLWKNPSETREVDGEKLTKISEEIADVFIFLVYLCDEYSLDLLDIVKKKLHLNEMKYPIEKARGSNKKYTEL